MVTMTQQAGPYKSIADIRAANAAAGFHFFERETLRFFDSRIERTVYGGRFFITSEQFHGSDGKSAPRRYTVRVAHDDGSVTTMGEFNEMTLEQAREQAKQYARDLREGNERNG